MSRLDDELKLALGRVEPSPDFTDSVLKKIAPPNIPATTRKKGWWQPLLEMFRLPRVRWSAVALAASLMIMIGAFQYWQPRSIEREQKVVSKNVQTPSDQGNSNNSVEPTSTTPAITHNNGGSEVDPAPENIKDESIKYRPRRRPVKRAAPVEEIAAKAEGQIAKERLLLALRIASATLSDAQKAIRGDEESPAPAPVTR